MGDPCRSRRARRCSTRQARRAWTCPRSASTPTSRRRPIAACVSSNSRSAPTAPTPNRSPGAPERQASKLLPSCRAKAEPGQVVYTNSHNVRASRRGSLRLLLGGVDLSEAPDLADLCAAYGVEAGTDAERAPFPIYVDNSYYIRDYNKCVMCWRCVDVCGDQVQFTFAIEPAERGFEVRVGTSEYDGMMDTTCVYCGNCVQVCPSGALKGRAQWEAEQRGTLTDDRVVETTCSFCGVGCGLTAHVRDGAITHVDSPDDHPVNQGWLCVKGRYGWDYAQHEDRLTHPLIRVGARGEGRWRRASWDEALDLTAHRLAHHRDTHGTDAVAVYASSKCTNEENYLLQKFTRAALQTNNIDNCTRLCHASSVAALDISLGTGAFTNSLDEIAENDVIFVTGSNTTETHPITALKMKAAVRDGAQLIVADPRAIELTRWADVHLQFRTGTDVPHVQRPAARGDSRRTGGRGVRIRAGEQLRGRGRVGARLDARAAAGAYRHSGGRHRARRPHHRRGRQDGLLLGRRHFRANPRHPTPASRSSTSAWPPATWAGAARASILCADRTTCRAPATWAPFRCISPTTARSRMQGFVGCSREPGASRCLRSRA